MSISEFTACRHRRHFVPTEVFMLPGKNSNIPKGLLHSILLQGKQARNAFFFYYSPNKLHNNNNNNKKSAPPD